MSNALENLLKKFDEKSAVIAVIGVGYVGLPLALRFADVGFKVIGFDVDDARVDQLNSGQSGIKHIDDDFVAAARAKGFEVTADFSRIKEADGIMICVPTPLNKHREPDMRFVVGSCEEIAPFLRSGQVISLESTTYPGTTREILVPSIECNGLIAGETVFAVYSPEREDPANPNFSTNTIPKVLGGHTENCLKAGIGLYSHAVDQLVPVSSTDTAEMTKILENIYRAVNVGLVNEMKIVADRMGIDIFEVIEAAATKPFGFTPFYPGPGLGGHCIPIDPFYLTWKAREYGVHTRFIELAGEVNSGMPQFVFHKIVGALNAIGKSVKGAKVMVLGIAYKKNVGDMRESPSVAIMELLRAQGAELSYADPHVPVFPPMREHIFDLAAKTLTPATLASQDAVIIATNHDDLDYDMIKRNARLIIDARGVYREPADHIVRA